MTIIEANLLELSQQMSSLKSSISSHDQINQPCSRINMEQSQGPAMQANTSSPHMKKEIITPCSPFVKYEPNAVPVNLKEDIINLVNEKDSQFSPVGEDSSRQVLYFGEHSYRYTGKEHPPQEMPPVLKQVLEAVQTKLPSDKKLEVNSCLISRYQSGSNHIPLHRDDEPVIDPESLILTISIGAARKMTFTNNDKSRSEDLQLDDCSMLVTSRYAQDFWLHGILPDENVLEERISLTFRHIAPYFINSTKVFGDSNTSHIKFGAGSGTLGIWVPGQRVKTGHIEALPEATEVGPYRNIVIHTGINSINNPRFRKSDSYLLHVLENKCEEILTVYPRAKVHISLLLPSRSPQLNRHIHEFNSGILDLTYRMKNVSVIDNSIFGNVLSNEMGRWDVNRQRPYTEDIVHLGRKGIRTLAMNFKMSVLGKGKPQSRSRFDAGNGSYRAALGYNQQSDGYQSSR